MKARKNVPGVNGAPTHNPSEINEGFPLQRLDWDFNSVGGKEHLKVYHQALLSGLRCDTLLTKVREVKQGPMESLEVFLERLMEVFCRNKPDDPRGEERKAKVSIVL